MRHTHTAHWNSFRWSHSQPLAATRANAWRQPSGRFLPIRAAERADLANNCDIIIDLFDSKAKSNAIGIASGEIMSE